MESFTIDKVSNASFSCYPNEGEWEVAISEKSYPSLNQNVTEGKFTYVEKVLRRKKNYWTGAY